MSSFIERNYGLVNKSHTY